MNRICLLAIWCLLAADNVSGQRAQYTRPTLKIPRVAAMQLVPDIAGSNHLLCFNTDQNPVIYVFNAQLQAVGSREVNIKLKATHDIHIVSFKNHYFLYLHSPGSSQHYLFDVKADGSSSDISSCLNRPSDTLWNQSTATYQLFNQNEHLAILSHSYYERIERVGSTFVRMNHEFIPESLKTVLFPFDRKTEILSQVTVAGNNLLVLKLRHNEEGGHEMRMLKINMATGQYRENFFNAGPHLYVNAAFRYKPDSTFLISSLIRQPAGSQREQRVVFIAVLGDTLQLLEPIALLNSQFRKNAADNFLLVGGRQQIWLHMNIGQRPKTFPGNRNKLLDYGMDGQAAFNIEAYEKSKDLYERAANTTAIRFSLLDQQLKTQSDSLVTNKEGFYDMAPKPFGRFEMNGKAYLVMIQNFTPQQRGMLLIGTDSRGRLHTRELPVYERYDYNVNLLKAVGNEYFIMPFSYKNEIGLVKIIMKE